MMKNDSVVSNAYGIGFIIAFCGLFMASVQAASNTDSQALNILGVVESFSDKLLNMRLYDQQLDSNTAAKTSFNERVIKDHELFCAQNGALAGQNCSQSDPALENADLQVSSLLGLPIIPEGDQGLNLAARIFSRNMVSSSKTTFNTYQYSEVQGPNKDKTKADEYATGLISASIMSVPAFSFGAMYGNRQMSAGYQDLQNPDAQPTSLMNFMAQISGRIQDRKWIEDVIKITDPLVLQRKQIFMQAEQLMMDYQRYKQGERIEALLAALVIQKEREREATAEFVAQTKPPPPTSGTIITTPPSTNP